MLVVDEAHAEAGRESSVPSASVHPPAFALRSGCVEYDGIRALDEVDLEVQPGEFIAILGENGAGKTTLIRALLGLTPLTCGALEIHGVQFAHFRDWHRIGYVPQRLVSAGTVPVSVLEVVRSARVSPRGRWRWGNGVDGSAAKSALNSVGLWERRDDRLDTLSGGQQRRVLIARALAGGADTLVFDEPTAGVDAESQVRLAEALKQLSDDGRTVLLVTHDLGPVADLATRAIVLGHSPTGSVLYDGPEPPDQHRHDHHAHHSEDLVLRTQPEPRLLEGRP